MVRVRVYSVLDGNIHSSVFVTKFVTTANESRWITAGSLVSSHNATAMNPDEYRGLGLLFEDSTGDLNIQKEAVFVLWPWQIRILICLRAAITDAAIQDNCAAPTWRFRGREPIAIHYRRGIADIIELV